MTETMTGMLKSSITAPVTAHDRFIRLPEVLARVGVSWMTLNRWEKLGKFPQRYRIGPNTVAWLESEIDEWCARQNRQAFPSGGNA